MKKPRKLFIITGTSAVGKTTIGKLLLKKSRKLKRSLTFTTRPRRRGEANDRDYHFIGLKKFKDKIKRSDFLEYANNYGNFYGTDKKNIQSLLKKGFDVLVIIDIKGTLAIKKKWSDAVAFFILPESLKQLEKRFQKRADTTKEQIKKRLKIARWELKLAAKCDYQIINRENKVDQAVGQILSVIKN